MARPKTEKKHLFEKRAEIMWALDEQGYNGQEIGIVFGISRSVVNRIMSQKPKDWKPKWIKVQ